MIAILLVLSGAIPEHAIEHAKKATVYILAEQSAGSGVIVRVDDDGFWVLTAAHCCPDAEQLSVYIYGQDVWVRNVSIAKISRVRDIALLRCESDIAPPVIYTSYLNPIPGTEVATIGCNEGKPTLVSAKVGEIQMSRFTLNSSIAAGRSGGPVIREDGSLVGLQVANENSTGICVGLDDIRWAMSSTNWGHLWLAAACGWISCFVPLVVLYQMLRDFLRKRGIAAGLILWGVVFIGCWVKLQSPWLAAIASTVVVFMTIGFFVFVFREEIRQCANVEKK